MITYSGLSTIQLLALLVSVVLPALVALVTKRLASPGLKAVTLAALAAVLGALTELLDALQTGTTYDVGAALMTWLTAFTVAVAVHYGLLKPAGVTGSRGAIASHMPGGIGSDEPGRHSVEAIVRRLKDEDLRA